MSLTVNIQQASDVWSLTQFLTTPPSYRPSFPPLCLWQKSDSWLRERLGKGWCDWLEAWVTWLQVLALLQIFCMVLSKPVPLQFHLCPAKVTSSTSAMPERVVSCDNHVAEDELHRLCRLRGPVSISAALHFPGDWDWEVVRSPARLLFWSKSTLPSLLFPYWAVFQILNCPKQVSVCINALKCIFLNREKSLWKPLWPLIIKTWRNNWF